MNVTRPLLYVCAPWRRRTPESMRFVRLAVVRAVSCGWVPIFAPMLFDFSARDGGAIFDDEDGQSRALALAVDGEILKRCDALVIPAPWLETTEGMAVELRSWEVTGRPKFHGWDRIQDGSAHLVMGLPLFDGGVA